MSTGQKLKKLFDYQKFEQNPKLAQMIREAGSDRKELSDENLLLVNAAGTQDQAGENPNRSALLRRTEEIK